MSGATTSQPSHSFVPLSLDDPVNTAILAISEDTLEGFQRDPFGDGPFEYEPFDGGFELRSKFKAQDKQVALTVGRRKEK